MGLNPESYFLLGDLGHALLPQGRFLFATLEPRNSWALSCLPALFAFHLKTKLSRLALPLCCSPGLL